MLAHGTVRRGCRCDGVADRAQIAGRESSSNFRRLRQRRSFDCRHNAKIGADEQRTYRLGVKLLAANEIEVVMRDEYERIGPSALGPSCRDDPIADGGKIECIERSLIRQRHGEEWPQRESFLRTNSLTSAGSAFPRDAFIT